MSRETSIFKIIIIDDVNLWSTWYVSLLDFINSISQADDIEDVSAQTVGGQNDLLALGGGVVRRLRPPPLLATGLLGTGGYGDFTMCRCLPRASTDSSAGHYTHAPGEASDDRQRSVGV